MMQSESNQWLDKEELLKRTMKKILVSNREAEGKGSKESNPEWHRRLGWLQHNPWKLMFSEKDGFEQGASIGSQSSLLNAV